MNRLLSDRRIGVVILSVLALLILGWLSFRKEASLRPNVVADLARPPHEIIPGSKLYYLGADRMSSTASYAVSTAKGIVVIDPGMDYRRLKAAFGALSLRVTDVSRVVITHRHADHWFCTRELVGESGAIVMAHTDEVPVLIEASDLAHYFSIHSPTTATVPTLSHVEGLSDGQVIELGDLRIEVIATPGHTPGSACYYATIGEHRVLWTGDTVDSLVAESLGGLYMTRLGPRFGGDMRQYLQSLHRLATLPVDIVLPGHHVPLAFRRANPLVGVEGWKRLLAPSTATLERWMSEHPEQIDLFLDGTPKPLTKEIFYLGECDSTASYVLRTADGLVLVDPGRRNVESLLSQMDELGLPANELQIVLLTALDGDHAASAPELCERSGATVVCGHVPDENIPTESIRVVRHGEELVVGDTKVTALAGLDGAHADRCYLVARDRPLALFGGDTIGRFPQTGGNTHRKSTAKATIAPEIRSTLRLLKEQPVDLVLPAHPQFDESPFYFSGEWEQLTHGWQLN